MAAAFEVYNDRGHGMAEEIYQERFILSELIEPGSQPVGRAAPVPLSIS